jgi:hypothetical protein
MSAAVTLLAPSLPSGAVNAHEKSPPGGPLGEPVVAVQGEGIVPTFAPLNSIVMAAAAAKPVPFAVTFVPNLPLLGIRASVAAKGVTDAG